MRQGRMSKLVPVAIVTAVIVVLSYRPAGMLDFGIEGKVPGVDKVGHGAIYAVLAWLLLRAQVGRGRVRPVLAALLAAMFIGGVIELTQPWVGRTGALSDWLADVAGASLAIALWLAVSRTRATDPAAGRDGTGSP